MTADQLLLARLALAALVVGIAWMIDARTSKIPNALTFPAIVTPLFLRGSSLTGALMDWAVALLIGLGAGMFLFRRRAMGGGAAKLFTAVCVCLTPQGTITAVLTLALWMMVATIASRGSSRERAPKWMTRGPFVVAATAIAGGAVSWFMR